jgi:hypothetical protein
LNILNKTVQILTDAQLIDDYADFSTNYAERNAGWLSYTIHKQRDFTVETSINALKRTRLLKQHYANKQKQLGGVVDEYIHALNKVSTLLEQHLETKHGILKIKY